ncbi:M1 family metallopeptidase [Paenibacillus alkalitolerans]|uniref:M1 family metallopeptidase n=1 Tax=Paenibacillus alkalitolerans TaxID=2799335 RepID=UPI001F305671|nr:M1 family metallopeptidase [Paenibacillus alkalitolerans]
MKRFMITHGRTTVLLLFAVAVLITVWTGGREPSAFDAAVIADEAGPKREGNQQKPANQGKSGKSTQTAPLKAMPEPPAPEKPKAPEPLSNRVVEYHIGVRLDAGSKKLLGNQTVTWRNPGSQPVQELYFHLYPNAFESKQSTFNRESGGKLRNDEASDKSIGYMNVTSIHTTEGLDLTHRMQYAQPDDGNKNDRSLMKVRLARPVSPNDTVTLKMGFEVQLPEVYARMGYSGNFVMAGQWFPKVAVYEPAGRRGRTAEGWNAHQYHGNSEFYSDFGIFNVKIQVPEKYIVAATGFPTKPASIDKKTGMKTYHFYADDVHDFAWAGSPDFVYTEEPFSAPNVPGVRIKLYLDPKHIELKDRYMYAIKKSLENYSSWYGKYPYSTLSVVVPPEGADGAGGMEYPTLITAWAADAADAGYELEKVVVHEIGHQYWYGMVASNEFEEAWLDEGFTSYAEDKVMEAEYGVPPNTLVEASYMTNPASLTSVSWNFKNHDHYADNVYIRGKLILLAIEKEIGEKKMKQVMRTYFTRWKFRHPATGDFQKTLEDVTKRSWAEFFDQFVYGDLMVDYAVERIVSKKVRTDGVERNEYRVVVSSRSGLQGPVTVRFRFDDGATLNEQWKGDQKSVVFTLPPTESKLRWVAVDPEYASVLEHKRMNNFMKTNVSDELKARWNLGTAKFIEAIIGSFVW